MEVIDYEEQNDTCSQLWSQIPRKASHGEGEQLTSSSDLDNEQSGHWSLLLVSRLAAVDARLRNPSSSNSDFHPNFFSIEK